MTLVILYLSTFVVFLGIDFFGLGYVVKPTFERDIGHLLLKDFRILPAFAFYAFFVAVLVWFVSHPALLQDKSLWWVLGNAALLGAGLPFTFTALLGLLSLSGMLIKNGIVLVEEIDLVREEGVELRKAIIDASASRVRPVALAAISPNEPTKSIFNRTIM